MFCFSSFYSVEPKVCFSFGISLFVLKYMWGWWVAVLLPIRFSWTQKSCASLHPHSPKTPELLSKTQELSPAPYLWTAMSPHQLGPPAGPGPSPHAWVCRFWLRRWNGPGCRPQISLYILTNFSQSSTWKGALVTQLMTLSFSVVKLREEAIKNTLNAYLAIFVKHDVIIMGNQRWEEMGTCKWDFLNFMVLLNHNSNNSWITVNILKLT